MEKFEELNWELQGSEYHDADLILFDKRIDKRKNPRTQKVLDRLVLEGGRLGQRRSFRFRESIIDGATISVWCRIRGL
ncbi:MAG: hypothetical protein CM15mV40_220 [Caudoviricetes sp.]|nr:MAG: hypothetical protein CM15mV40_220 [Caudoviricetes sp.]